MAVSRPSISRDTRWLLIIVAVSLTALSVLARWRFRDPGRLAGPIAPVLSQLQRRSAFADMSAAVEALLPRLHAAVVPLALTSPTAAADGEAFVPALRFRDGFVAALAPTTDRPTSSAIVAVDRVTRLAVARAPGETNGGPSVWEPGAPFQSRFFVAVSAPSGQVVAQPFFVATLVHAVSPRWPAPVWTLHGGALVAPGTLLFTLEGALAGLVVDLDGHTGLVPPSVVMGEAERILAAGDSEAGRLDFEVLPLTDALKAATGATAGVVVSRIAPSGPAAGLLRIGDVITDVGGEPVISIAYWQSRLDRVTAEQPVALTLWREGSRVPVTVVARGDALPVRLPLGLRLRTLPRLGARIETVAEGSAAQRAGLRTGDVLTRVGDVDSPTAVQANRAFNRATSDRPLLLGITRGETHLVMAMDRRW